MFIGFVLTPKTQIACVDEFHEFQFVQIIGFV